MSTRYKTKALKIIAESSFEILPGNYVYTKVKSIASIAGHFFVSKDDDEITVVTKAENAKMLSVIEHNKDLYRLIGLKVSSPFYAVGFLATVSDAFAKNDMNVLLISTYSKDYVVIRADLIDKAKEILLELGFKSSAL